MSQILLVEDNRDLAAAIASSLTRVGIDVLTADRMDVALGLFSNNAVDLIVTDFHIKQGSGRRLLYEIRKRHSTVPIFLITGTPYIDEKDLAQYQFNRVFLKPFPLNDFIGTIVEALKRA